MVSVEAPATDLPLVWLQQNGYGKGWEEMGRSCTNPKCETGIVTFACSSLGQSCFSELFSPRSLENDLQDSETDTQKTCGFGKYSRRGLCLAKTFRFSQDRKERLCTKSAFIWRKHLLKCHLPQLPWSKIWVMIPFVRHVPVRKGLPPVAQSQGFWGQIAHSERSVCLISPGKVSDKLAPHWGTSVFQRTSL